MEPQISDGNYTYNCDDNISFSKCKMDNLIIKKCNDIKMANCKINKLTIYNCNNIIFDNCHISLIIIYDANILKIIQNDFSVLVACVKNIEFVDLDNKELTEVFQFGIIISNDLFYEYNSYGRFKYDLKINNNVKQYSEYLKISLLNIFKYTDMNLKKLLQIINVYSVQNKLDNI